MKTLVIDGKVYDTQIVQRMIESVSGMEEAANQEDEQKAAELCVDIQRILAYYIHNLSYDDN